MTTSSTPSRLLPLINPDSTRRQRNRNEKTYGAYAKKRICAKNARQGGSTESVPRKIGHETAGRTTYLARMSHAKEGKLVLVQVLSQAQLKQY